jgi:hypothetical protein
MERFLKDKAVDIKMAALKNMHVFLKELPEDKRPVFIKYIVQTFDEAGKSEWRLKQALAQNLGNYSELFDSQTVYNDFLPMFFKFCSDNVAQVGIASCSAMAEIIEKFNDDEVKQAGIVRVVRSRYFKSKTFKKRQLYIQMCQGPLMNKKELFEKYFKLDFLSLVNDRVSNVRIGIAKALRHHFLKEISGAMVFDPEVNDAVRILKQDSSEDVRFYVNDIETYKDSEHKQVTMESFLQTLADIRLSTSNRSDTDSMNSEDESRIEQEIKRHNSEEEIDHGPVLRSLRLSRQNELVAEEQAKKIIREEKKKAKDMKDVLGMLDEVSLDSDSDSKKQPQDIEGNSDN